MGLEEPELDEIAGALKEGPQVAQTKAGVLQGPAGHALQVGDLMLLGQVQQALEGADRLGTTVAEHGLAPGAAAWAEQPAAAEEILSAALDQGPLVGMDVLGVGRETPGLGPGVDRDLVHLGGVDAHEPRLRPDPEGAADKLGRHGIVGPAKLDVAVAADQATALLEAREEHGRQRPQGRLLRRHEKLKHLLAHGSVDAGVGDCALPLGEKLVLLAKAREGAALEGVILVVFDARLDLALMPGHGGLGRGQDRPVMPAELDQLGIEIRVEPVGLEHGGL